ncbi:MAG: hypothetical protein ABJP87_04425 [Bauldia litoralis]|uniref:hypothetical protein n=1 Tax=Bauldia litoralis TaxID=665467 RepID=UPI00329986AB
MENQAVIKIATDVEAIFKEWASSPEVRKLVEETEKSAEETTGSFEVIITTENLDRYQEVISLEGWDLEHYRNNPVVLWGHDHNQLPIGVATSVEVKDGKMIAHGKFAPHEFAQTIRKLYDLGMMKATSVGFIEKEREGNLITKAELLEFSFVSVPANPYALSLMVKEGVSINDMVTKGILSPEKEKEAPEEEAPEVAVVSEETPEKEPETPESEPIVEEQPADEPVVEEKHFQSKSVEPIVASLKGIIVALEELSTKTVEETPEGNEEPKEEEKQLAEFSAKRKTLQDAATILGDVLAEARRGMEKI